MESTALLDEVSWGVHRKIEVSNVQQQCALPFAVE